MNFAHGFSKARIFALRVCPDQLLFLDVLRASLAQRGSKESYIADLCGGYQHNKVFQKLLKLMMNRRPVIDLHWALEGLSQSSSLSIPKNGIQVLSPRFCPPLLPLLLSGMSQDEQEPPGADAALEAECCCVSEGAASLGSRCASSRLQQKSALKPDQLPPRNNKMGNTALSTEGWEVAPRVPSSVTAPGQSSKV
ncbi:hypothetical protein TURU_151245 [Turdus rufiventris]|nr:hypothetical protein TURU_151245 [Turdus rufiventris]